MGVVTVATDASPLVAGVGADTRMCSCTGRWCEPWRIQGLQRLERMPPISEGGRKCRVVHAPSVRLAIFAGQRA